MLQNLLRQRPLQDRDVRPLVHAFGPWLCRRPLEQAETDPPSQFVLLDTLIQLVLDAAERGHVPGRVY